MIAASKIRSIAEAAKEEGIPVSFRDPYLSEEMFFGKVDTVAELLENFTFEIFPGTWIEVPKGFVTDGASIPRLVWTLVGHPFGKYFNAAIAHDWLCRHSQDYEDRCTADAAFRGLLKKDGVGYWRRLTMYRALEIAARWEWRVTPEQKKRYSRWFS